MQKKAFFLNGVCENFTECPVAFQSLISLRLQNVEMDVYLFTVSFSYSFFVNIIFVY